MRSLISEKMKYSSEIIKELLQKSYLLGPVESVRNASCLC